MTPKNEEGGDDQSRSPKQRRDSGYAPLSLDEEIDLTKILSSIKIRRTAQIPLYASRSSVPQLFSFKDVQARAQIDFAFSQDWNIQDRSHNTMVPMAISHFTVPARVSRFEDVFEQMRKKDQVALEAPSNLTVSSKLDACGSWVQPRASIDALQSEQATASSDTAAWLSLKSLHSRKSSSRGSNVSLKANDIEAGSGSAPTRKQEILQMSTWRSLAETPEQDASSETLHINRIASPEETAFTRAQAIAATVRAKQTAIERQFGPGTLRAFHPSHRALQRDGVLPDRDASRASTESTRSSSPCNYLGDPSVENNHSADIPEGENCALWVWGLPGRVTYGALLAAIRDIGKVYATVINPPTQSIRTSAAKIVFFRRHEAEKLFNIIENRQFVVMGKVIHRVLWNKIRSGPFPHWTQSRAIRITGPKELMDFEYFQKFFTGKFTYDLDVKRAVECNRYGFMSHEWHFGSLRSQAASAKTAIERELKGIYEVEWAEDPCEFP